MWGIPAFLFLLAFLHRVAPGVMAKDLMQAFGATGTLLGLLSATYFYSYSGFMLPGGLLIDALGARRVVAAGSAAADLVVAIGPSIGPCCYEVDAPVIERLEAAFPGGWEPSATPKGPGKWMLDLWRANLDQLTAAGVRPGRVDNLGLCTGCRPDLLFSYRRERGAGRLVTVAALPERAC